MGLRSFGDIGNALSDAGKYHYQYVYKPAIPNSLVTNNFTDCNQSAGTPKYNPLSGSALVATPLVGAGNEGVFTGPTIAGHTKYLASIQSTIISAGAPSYLYLNDYLLVYPLIDGDDTAEQVMDNTAPLPRYASGEGVRAILVATAPMTVGDVCTVKYTNSQGVTGRTTTFNLFPAQGVGVCATASGTTSVSNSTCTPFWPLASGDTGMRAIESITFNSSLGGFLSVVLVKPITQMNIIETAVPTEKVFGIDSQVLPEILNGAYLNFLLHRGGSGSTAPLYLEMVFINVQE